MLTTFTNHKSLFSLKEISARSKMMRCFQYVCVSLSSILSLGNVRWWILLMCVATVALMFLSTECVASSISRWHGCKAEYYLLSCSTHSVLIMEGTLLWLRLIVSMLFLRSIWLLYFLSAFERACMILTGTNSSHAPSSSHLAKVYPTSTSMHLAWVADPFFSDFQKRSPLSVALSSKHKSYAKLL